MHYYLTIETISGIHYSGPFTQRPIYDVTQSGALIINHPDKGSTHVFAPGAWTAIEITNA